MLADRPDLAAVLERLVAAPRDTLVVRSVTHGVEWGAALVEGAWAAAVVCDDLSWAPAADLIRALRAACPASPVWAVTRAPQVHEALTFVRAGAADCLVSDARGLLALAELARRLLAPRAEPERLAATGLHGRLHTPAPRLAAPRSTPPPVALTRPPSEAAPSTPYAPRQVAHDLLEPLRSLSVWTSLAAVHAAPTGESRELLERSQATLRRLQARVGALVAGEPPGASETVEASEVWREVVSDLSAQVSAACADVHAGPLPSVRMGRDDLARVLQNLLSNALKFRAAAPPRVRLTTRVTGPLCEFRLADNGIGVAPADRWRVLQFLERGAHGDARAGHGLGLATSADLVRAAGGQLWLDPGVTEGATVCFTVPLARSE